MSKHPEPIIVTDYRERIRTPVPKCCHTCFEYNDQGYCTQYHQTPPADFAATLDACPGWFVELPF